MVKEEMAMADAIKPEMSDDEVKAVLEGLDIKDRDAMRKATADATPKQVFEVVFPHGFSKMEDIKEKLADINGSVLWIIEGDTGGQWAFVFADGNFKIEPGPKDDATTTITMQLEDWKAMQSGELNPQAAFMSGKIQIGGDMGFMMQLQSIMPQMG